MSPERPLLDIPPLASWGLGLDRPLRIAGPCSAESLDQVLTTARGVAEVPGVRVFRAGVWKPRTRPGTYEGAGEQALEWLRIAKQETGLLIATEVATPEHVQACLRAGIDILWIGARTTPNPFSVQAIADALEGIDIPVLVKNPVIPDAELWIGAFERLHRAGLTRLAAVHRGFGWPDTVPYRNSPMWEVPIRLMASFPDLPMVCDPSHITGAPERLAEVAQQALDLNYSGLMIETHVDPQHALSDRGQQIRPAQLQGLLQGLVYRDATPGPALRDRLQELRDQVDRLDADIARKLAARLELADRIGEYKRDHNVAILQPERWERIMATQHELGRALGLGEEFIEAFMNAIHQESIRRQTAVWERSLLDPKDR